MSRREAAHPKRFLTVIAWPDGWSKDEVVACLADAGAGDVPSLRLRLREPPAIVGQVEPTAAIAAARALIAAGGDAFAPSLADLTRSGATLKVKALRLADGGLDVDLWRGPSTLLRTAQLQVLVRAQLRESKVVRAEPPMGGPHASRLAGAALATNLGYGARGLALGLGPVLVDHSADAMRSSRRLQTSDKLDIHTTDGSVYQIDGDKFGFRVLGDLRGHSDKANMDRLCDLLAHLAPGAIVDPYFPLWHPPAGHERLRVPGMLVNKDDPAFAFYSRWVALMYRWLLREAGPSG